jgi:uncharacterized protein (DUF2249 family)
LQPCLIQVNGRARQRRDAGRPFPEPDMTTATPAFTYHPFDARGIARRFRHSAIFGALDALQPGEAMRFVNDHDPLPLLAQLRERYGERVLIEYVQREPGAIVIDFNIVA